MDNIVVKYQADTSDLKAAQAEQLQQLDELQAKEQELKKRISETDKEYQKFLLDIQASGRGIEQQEKDIIAAQNKRANSQKMFRNELKATQSDIQRLNTSLDSIDKTIEKGALGNTFVTRLRRIKEEIRQLEAAGGDTADRIKALSIEAAKLQQQISDTDKEINIMASRTRNLDAAMGVGQGLTGTFTAATSVIALFGGESEELQKTFFKVQAALQVLNGVQMVANSINQKSVANIVIRNALSKLFTKNKVAEVTAVKANTTATVAETTAVKGATIAQRLWNASMLANPVMWLVAGLAALVTIGSAIAKSFKSQIELQQMINSQEDYQIKLLDTRLAKIKEIRDERLRQLDSELRLMQTQGSSEDDIQKKREERAREELEWATKIFMERQKDIAQIKQNEAELKHYTKQLRELEIDQEQGESKSLFWLPDGSKFRGEVDDLIKEVERRISKLNDNVSSSKEIINVFNEAADAYINSVEASSQLAKQIRNREAQASADYSLLVAEKGSEKEKNARIKALKQGLQIELQNQNLGANQRLLKIEETNRQIEKINADFLKRLYQAEIAEINNRIEEVDKGTQEELDLRVEAIQRQRDIELLNADLSEREIQNIRDKYRIQEEKIRRDFTASLNAEQIQGVVAEQEKRLLSVRKESDEEYKIRKQILEYQAQIERIEVNNSEASEKEKARRILQINNKLQSDITNLTNQQVSTRIDNELRATQQRIELQRLQIEQQQALTGGIFGQISARMQLNQLAIDSINAETKANEEMYAKGLISEAEYQQNKTDLVIQGEEARLEVIKSHAEGVQAVLQAGYDAFAQIQNLQYDSQKEALTQRMNDLNEYYTTDADAAKKNTNLKLVSEREFQRKEMEIKREQAQVEKEQALFNAYVQLGQGIITALASAPPPYNAILAAITSSAILYQIAQIESRPLPKYAKGRKGGKGELSWVGEKGPEIMYVPNGASIIPAHKSNSLNPDIMRDYGIPLPNIPQMPNVSEHMARTENMGMSKMGIEIDYDKMGKALAKNIQYPEMSQLNVNMDESGFTKYLASKRGTTYVRNRIFNK